MLLVLVAALACAGASSAARAQTPTTQDVTIAMSDSTQLACGLTLPTDSPPSGGWPGVLLFPGFGQAHAGLDAIAVADLAPAGLASLACDERGTGASDGTFDVAGPRDVHDLEELFVWLTARSDVSDTEIGAFGLGSGGAEVWNAAAAGVPFKAIVPGDTWTSLSRALTPNGVRKSGVLALVTPLGPVAGWDATAGLTARSSRGTLHTLTVPTLLLQGKHDLLFDIDQARDAYKLLAGPKRLYVGSTTQALPEVTAWLAHYLAGGPAVGGSVEVATSGAKTETYRSLPPTRLASVDLPGTTMLKPSTLASRTVRLPGGPFETFGDGSVSVRYSGAAKWDHLVATVSLKGSSTPLTEGAAPITAAAGVVKIPLMDVAAVIPRGKPLVVTVGATSRDGVFGQGVPAGAKLRAARFTCTLTFLDR